MGMVSGSRMVSGKSYSDLIAETSRASYLRMAAEYSGTRLGGPLTVEALNQLANAHDATMRSLATLPEGGSRSKPDEPIGIALDLGDITAEPAARAGSPGVTVKPLALVPVDAPPGLFDDGTQEHKAGDASERRLQSSPSDRLRSPVAVSPSRPTSPTLTEITVASALTASTAESSVMSVVMPTRGARLEWTRWPKERLDKLLLSSIQASDAVKGKMYLKGTRANVLFPEVKCEVCCTVFSCGSHCGAAR